MKKIGLIGGIAGTAALAIVIIVLVMLHNRIQPQYSDAAYKTLEGQVSPNPTRAPLCKFKWGLRFDFNYDCKEDYADAWYIVVNANTCPVQLCDINSSGAVRALDAGVLAAALENRYDINEDGKFNKGDPEALSGAAAGNRVCDKELCDVSHDGQITAYDASLLLQILYTRYDINNDGVFNSADPQQLAGYVANQNFVECPLWKCDVSGDRAITSYDAAFLAQLLPQTQTGTQTAPLKPGTTKSR